MGINGASLMRLGAPDDDPVVKFLDFSFDFRPKIFDEHILFRYTSYSLSKSLFRKSFNKNLL